MLENNLSFLESAERFSKDIIETVATVEPMAPQKIEAMNKNGGSVSNLVIDRRTRCTRFTQPQRFSIYYLSNKLLYLPESDCSSMLSRRSLPGLALRGNGKISDGSTLKILAADSLSGGVWQSRRTRSIFECIRCFLSTFFSNAAPFHIQSLINISLRSPAWKYSEHSSSRESPSSARPWQTGCSLASSVAAYGGEQAGEIGGVGGNEKFFHRSSVASLVLVFTSAESSLKSLKSDGWRGSKSLLKLSRRRLLTDRAMFLNALRRETWISVES